MAAYKNAPWLLCRGGGQAQKMCFLGVWSNCPILAIRWLSVAEIRSRDGWVGRVNASSVLCSLPKVLWVWVSASLFFVEKHSLGIGNKIKLSSVVWSLKGSVSKLTRLPFVKNLAMRPAAVRNWVFLLCRSKSCAPRWRRKGTRPTCRWRTSLPTTCPWRRCSRWRRSEPASGSRKSWENSEDWITWSETLIDMIWINCSRRQNFAAELIHFTAASLLLIT